MSFGMGCLCFGLEHFISSHACSRRFRGVGFCCHASIELQGLSARPVQVLQLQTSVVLRRSLSEKTLELAQNKVPVPWMEDLFT